MTATEKEYTGPATHFKSTSFIDAAENLAGYTRKKPVQNRIIVEKAFEMNGVVGLDGKEEKDPVLALQLSGIKLRLRMNATKRKIMTKAANSCKVLNWYGLSLRLYQTVDLNPNYRSGGTEKEYVPAVAIDVQKKGSEGEEGWLRYFDFQMPRGKKHVKAFGLIGSGDA